MGFAMGYGIALKEAGEVELYRFGRSQQIFRGPKPSLRAPYVAFIGGSEPFGKFVANPYPKLVQKKLRQTCVNWGTPGAGPGFFLKDPVLLEGCSNADVCVVQVMDAVPLSNRMYSVYPRRNQRLRGVSEALKSLFPQVDFSHFRYVSAMIRKLRNVDPKAFKVVEAELKAAWIARMLELLEEIETRTMLLWLVPADIDDSSQLVTEDMVAILQDKVEQVLKIDIPKKTGKDLLFGGSSKETSWMTRSVHEKVAQEVTPCLQDLLNSDNKAVA